MATAAQAQALVDAAKCDLCTIPEGMIWYAVLAGLMDKGTGGSGSLPTNINDLMDEAKCLSCVIPEGLLPYAILEAVRNL